MHFIGPCVTVFGLATVLDRKQHIIKSAERIGSEIAKLGLQ
jgi:hypothetical protein